MNEWFDITATPPKHGKRYLAYAKNCMMVGTYTKWGWVFPAHFPTPTHYMELPTGPKEDSADE